MRGAVAAVDGGDVRRCQDGQALRVVPVVEVTAMARQLLQRVQRRRHALGEPGRADEAHLARTGRCQQVQADVGRRGAVRHHHVRTELHVVGRQMMVAHTDMALVVAPGLACQRAQVSTVNTIERRVLRRRAFAAGQPCPPSRGRPQQQQGCELLPVDVHAQLFGAIGDGSDEHRDERRAPMLPRQGRQVAARL